MNQELTFHPLEAVDRLASLSQDSKLNADFLQDNAKIINPLADYLGLDHLSTILFAVAFVHSYGNDNMKPVFEHLDLNPFMDLLKYRGNLELIYQKNLLKMKYPLEKTLNYFVVPSKVVKAISQNTPVPEGIEKDHQKVFADVLQELYYFSNNHSERYDNDDVVEQLDTLINDNAEFPFVQQMDLWMLSDFEKFFLMGAV